MDICGRLLLAIPHVPEMYNITLYHDFLTCVSFAMAEYFL